MAKRRKKKRGLRESAADAGEPALSGIARLLSEAPAAVLDLHGLTAAQAERRVRDFLVTHRHQSAGRVLHIVTGKGTRSEGRAVLLHDVRELLDGPLAAHREEVAGLSGGGGFAVRVPAAGR